MIYIVTCLLLISLYINYNLYSKITPLENAISKGLILEEEFLKYYIGNEINPKFEIFLTENPTWKAFFKKFKQDFKEIRNYRRLFKKRGERDIETES